jgi:thiosulfate dehydrogenase (quinone) large subunit
MTTQIERTDTLSVSSGSVASDTVSSDVSVKESWYHDFVASPVAGYFAGITRILLGFTFLWAFLDKTFGLGYATESTAKWLFGTGDGSPTFGFLAFGTNPNGPAASFYHSLGDQAGVMGAQGPTLYPNSWVNWLFMLGLLGIGLSLILGVFTRIATVSGVAMLALMYLAEAPWATYTDATGATVAANNPVVDDHVVFSVVLILLMLLQAGRFIGFGKWWQSLGFVKHFPWLA